MTAAPRKTYHEMLLDPRWQKKRLEILESHEWACDSCSSKERTLHVHHKVYWPGCAPWEYQNGWLAVLCDVCHEEETERALEHKATLSAEGEEPEFHKRIAKLLPGLDPENAEQILFDLMFFEKRFQEQGGRWYQFIDLLSALSEGETPSFLAAAVQSWNTDRGRRGSDHNHFHHHLKAALEEGPSPETSAPNEAAASEEP